MADREGASALLVFPPNSMSMGGQLRPEMAIAHFRRIADATNLPIIVFQYPMGGGLGYPFDTLLQLFDRVPSIRAIKDWSNDAMLHERHIRTFQNLPRPVNVLTTHSSWLMASLCMGPNGLLSGAGSVIADLHVALFRAVQAGDLKAAQVINDRIVPLSQVFYAHPFLDMHNRMKEALVLLGRLDKAVVRPPLVKIGEAEIARIAQALESAGIGREGALKRAA
jgi:4-hydroxy-tetrahydrodipicolinate synthase